MTAIPTVELDEPYSAPGAKPVPWSRASDTLNDAGVYWLSTVRSDGRPHVTPVAGVLLDGSLYFPTGPKEQKARNLETNTHCIITTGCNNFLEGFDVIVEGDAVGTTDKSKLERLTELFAAKYDDVFGFEVSAAGFIHDEGGTAHLFEVRPLKAFAYERSASGSATRYRF